MCISRDMLMRRQRAILMVGSLLLNLFCSGQTVMHIENAQTWTTDKLSRYVGQTVRFDAPFYVTNNYGFSSGTYTVSPRRIYSPTNQEYPMTEGYTTIVSLNTSGTLSLSGISGYHRMGERIQNLTVRIIGTNSMQWVSGEWVGNTRTELEAGIPSVDILGEHTLLVCAFNLEYYLAENLGTGYGPDNEVQHARQKNKISTALNKIRADVFGFVEIEQGQTALAELADTLTAMTGKKYSYIDDGGSANSSYTKSGYVYCTETLKPVGALKSNNTRVQNRKKMQAFQEISTGEHFIFSINHFKAKSGTGTGMNADQGDGQGTFNYDRVQEAQSVLTDYQSNRAYYGDPDILIMGDLNAYAKEDPITTLVKGGMTDLHRYFHEDTAYSYVFRGTAGYLDHALTNRTLLEQVTGVAAYHINSDEDDSFTYDGRNNDGTMFRCSDHDPVLVGLRLGAAHTDLNIVRVTATYGGLNILNADGGYYMVGNTDGTLLTRGDINSNDYVVNLPLQSGFYIVTVYANGTAEAHKLMVVGNR